jgi:hypothetical protein
MGKKKDKSAQKQLKRRTRRLEKLAKTMCSPKGCKPSCCEKFRKGEHKRCKKCPCFDLLKELRKPDYQQVA